MTPIQRVTIPSARITSKKIDTLSIIARLVFCQCECYPCEKLSLFIPEFPKVMRRRAGPPIETECMGITKAGMSVYPADEVPADPGAANNGLSKVPESIRSPPKSGSEHSKAAICTIFGHEVDYQDNPVSSCFLIYYYIYPALKANCQPADPPPIWYPVSPRCSGQSHRKA